jgi:nitroreductase
VELIEALRTTGAVRSFEPRPVSDATIHRVLDSARFAPSGGNRQGWRVVVVKKHETRVRLRDLYLRGWYEYLAQAAEGLVPWAPVTDEARERQALTRASEMAERAAAGPEGFAERFDEVPCLLVLLADLRVLAAVDRDLDRYSMAGGASVYPFAWSVLLAAREEGLGGVMTTMAIRGEDEVKALLHVPPELVVAGVIALGYEQDRPRRLRRDAVEAFASIDSFDGAPLTTL